MQLEVNWIAVVVATVVSMIIAGVWYQDCYRNAVVCSARDKALTSCARLGKLLIDCLFAASPAYAAPLEFCPHEDEKNVPSKKPTVGRLFAWCGTRT